MLGHSSQRHALNTLIGPSKAPAPEARVLGLAFAFQSLVEPFDSVVRRPCDRPGPPGLGPSFGSVRHGGYARVTRWYGTSGRYRMVHQERAARQDCCVVLPNAPCIVQAVPSALLLRCSAGDGCDMLCRPLSHYGTVVHCTHSCNAPFSTVMKQQALTRALQFFFAAVSDGLLSL